MSTEKLFNAFDTSRNHKLKKTDYNEKRKSRQNYDRAMYILSNAVFVVAVVTSFPFQ